MPTNVLFGLRFRKEVLNQRALTHWCLHFHDLLKTNSEYNETSLAKIRGGFK